MTEQAEAPSRGRHGIRIERLTYATVVLMSVLAVTEDWRDITTLAAVAVITAPLLALAIAHFFAELLQAHAELERPLTASEWRRCAREQGDDLIAAIPPLVAVGLSWLFGFDVETTVWVLLWFGLASLVALAAIAAHRAGMRSWRLLAAASAGGAMGLLVISLQILLKPH